MTGISGNMGRAVYISRWKMGIRRIDHDSLSNRRKCWIEQSRVVSVPSNLKQCNIGRRPCDTDIGSSPRQTKSI